MKAAPVRDVDEYKGDGDVVWFASIPELPGSQCITHTGHSTDGDWIAVERPRIPPRPQPPIALWGWLIDDREPTSDPELRGLDEGEELPDTVVTAYSDYLDACREWTATHGRRVPLLALYERLFRIKQQADQLGERYETVVAAGLVLVPDAERGRVRRHLLTMRAEVHYEPQTGRITVRPAADGISVQFEDEMLDPGLIPSKDLRESVHAVVEAAGTNIWLGNTIEDALTTWTQAMRHDALFDPRLDVPPMPPEGLLVALAPALILRKRTARSLLAFYQKVDDQLDSGTLVPGLVAGLVAEPDGGPSGDGGGPSLPEDDELYFPKPYNAEQLDVLRRMAMSDGVVVVGPPGTGKSHTIANLVSHLLAHGQRVLVTSHTSRALEVLLDKLPDEIRWLSVSLVGDGRAGMRELQRSVGALVNRSTDAEWQMPKIDQRISRYRQLRERAHEERRRHLAAIREVREGDAKVHEPGLGGHRGTLSQIAAQLADEREVFGWASSILGESPALADAEALELAGLARSISPEVEASTRVPIPDLPPGEDFAEMCHRIADLEAAGAGAAESRQLPYAGALAATTHADRMALSQAIDRLQLARATVAVAEGWELPAFEGALGGPVAKWRERKARTAEWIASLRETAAIADGLEVTGTLVRGARRGPGGRRRAPRPSPGRSRPRHRPVQGQGGEGHAACARVGARRRAGAGLRPSASAAPGLDRRSHRRRARPHDLVAGAPTDRGLGPQRACQPRGAPACPRPGACRRAMPCRHRLCGRSHARPDAAAVVRRCGLVDASEGRPGGRRGRGPRGCPGGAGRPEGARRGIRRRRTPATSCPQCSPRSTPATRRRSPLRAPPWRNVASPRPACRGATN